MDFTCLKRTFIWNTLVDSSCLVWMLSESSHPADLKEEQQG